MIVLARCGYSYAEYSFLHPGDGMDWDVHLDHIDELHKVQRTPHSQQGLPGTQPSFNVSVSSKAKMTPIKKK